VSALSRAPESFVRRAPRLASWPGLSWLRGDVRDFAAPPGTFEHVIHAAVIPTPPTDARETLDVILRGTRATLTAAVAAKASRFLLVGSGAVYGPQPADLAALDEDHAGAPAALEPSSANGEGKRAAELMAVLEGSAHGLAVTLARGFALLGPFLPLGGPFAAGNFVRDALAGGPVQVGGDGTPVRTYLYASDMAEWLWTIHLRGRPGRAYNFGGVETTTIAELARRVARLAVPADGAPLEVRLARLPDAAGAASRYVPSVERARRVGLVPRVGLDDAIQRTLGYWRARG
jgi:dTDP-glucose 4,6-dehydratase